MSSVQGYFGVWTTLCQVFKVTFKPEQPVKDDHLTESLQVITQSAPLS